VATTTTNNNKKKKMEEVKGRDDTPVFSVVFAVGIGIGSD
jgi:hypothetical protein